MSIRNTTFSLACGTMLAACIAVAQAQAAVVASYAAKFVCGPISSDADVVAGDYRTAINIHNPQIDTTVIYTKKFVIALPEGQTQHVPVRFSENLGPDQVQRVDCPVIAAAFKIALTSHIEGFVVVELPQPATTTGGQTLFLDVVGMYTAGHVGSESESVDVVVYGPTVVIH